MTEQTPNDAEKDDVLSGSTYLKRNAERSVPVWGKSLVFPVWRVCFKLTYCEYSTHFMLAHFTGCKDFSWAFLFPLKAVHQPLLLIFTLPQLPLHFRWSCSLGGVQLSSRGSPTCVPPGLDLQGALPRFASSALQLTACFALGCLLPAACGCCIPAPQSGLFTTELPCRKGQPPAAAATAVISVF